MDRDEARRVLGVAADSTPSDIRSAFRRLMRSHHRDVARIDDVNRARRIVAAYRLLTQEAARQNGAGWPASAARLPDVPPGEQSHRRPRSPPPETDKGAEWRHWYAGDREWEPLRWSTVSEAVRGIALYLAAAALIAVAVLLVWWIASWWLPAWALSLIVFFGGFGVLGIYAFNRDRRERPHPWGYRDDLGQSQPPHRESPPGQGEQQE